MSAHIACVDVLSHHVLAIGVGVLPCFEQVAKTVQPDAPVLGALELQLMEGNSLELVLGELVGQDMHANSCALLQSTMLPYLQSLSPSLVVLPPNQVIESLMLLHSVVALVPPNREVPFYLFLHISYFVTPQDVAAALDPLLFKQGAISFSFLGKKLFCLPLLCLVHLCELYTLLLGLHWLVGTLVPTLEAYLHLVVSTAFNHADESLQNTVASFVEFAIVEEFVEGLLLALTYHGLEQLKDYFAGKQLSVPLVVRLELRPLPTNLLDSAVVVAVELVQLIHEVIAFFL